MPTFLQPVDVPERCFLEEVLYWVTFQRLPIASYTSDGEELRETSEVGGLVVGLPDDGLTKSEADRAGIPPDPDWTGFYKEGSPPLPVEYYDRLLAKSDLDDDYRRKVTNNREAAVVYQRDWETWIHQHRRAIEYPASQIFVRLRSGALPAKGRLLPGGDFEAARSQLETDGRDVFDFAVTDIPPTFWSLQGMDFDASAAGNGTNYYCHISCRTDDVLSVFPGERQEVTGVQRLGDSFILPEKPSIVRFAQRRGRPPFPWSAFHLEVADLIRQNKLPEKKEAAIEHFRSWFDREHGIKASRSVVGEKLKPYYDRFLRGGGQKIR